MSLNSACLLEMASPMCPSYFLPIAAVATMGKNVSALASSASKAAFHLNLATGHNLADLTVKYGA